MTTTRKNLLSIVGTIEAHRLSSDVPILACLDVEVVDPASGVVVIELNYVHNTDPVQVNGVTYTPGKFDITISQEAGKVSEVNLSVTDYTQGLQSLMEQYQGGVGSRVTLYIVNGRDFSVDAEEVFEVVGATSQGYVQSFQLGAENVLAQTFPRRRQTRDFCQWRYKDVDTCGYTGTMPTCDLTLNGPNGCEAHANTINFGAYPGINSNGYRYM
jgi:phage-related protein